MKSPKTKPSAKAAKIAKSTPALPASRASAQEPSEAAPRIRPLAERRARDRQIMVDAILECAQELMRRDGSANLSLQELARMVGMQAPSLYEYFDGKFAIYNALFDIGVQQFQAKIFAKLQNHSAFGEQVQDVFDAFLEFYQESPELYRLVFEHPVPGFKASPESIARANTGFARGMAQLSDALAKEGLDLAIPAEQAVMLVEVAIFGVISRLLTNGPDEPLEARRFKLLIPALVTLLTGAPAGAALPAKANARRRSVKSA